MKILIVGGVAAGMSAAARARRLSEDSQIIVFERSGHVSFANCGLPYYIGGEIRDRDALLLQTPMSLKETLNIDVRVKHEVLAIDKNTKRALVKDLDKNVEYEENYDKLILAPGASPIIPQIPGVNLKNVFPLRNIEDMDAIRTVVDAGSISTALVVGGGYIGVEMAENLVERGIKVHLVQRHDQILFPFDKEMVRDLQNHIASFGVVLHLGSAAAAFREHDGRLRVELQNSELIDADMAVLSVGVRPDSRLAVAAGLEVNGRGGIKVSPDMRTNDPDIYAVGDVVEVLDTSTGRPAQIPLAGPANRQGRIAADNIFGLKSSYKGSLGTIILKVFRMSAACVGASEKSLKKAGRSYEKVYLHPSNHAGYYPGAAPMHLKLILSGDSGKILGAQAVGFEGVDKRIDVIATAIRGGLTVFDLEELELCYAPPFGSAKDAVNMAGFVGANLLRGQIECWYAEDFPEKTKNGLLIDVRPKDIFELRHIPGAINIPLATLRSRLSEIPKDKDIYLYCKVGFTSYIAYRIMKQNGFGQNGCSVKTLSGGITTFCCLHVPKICATETEKPFTPRATDQNKPEKFIPKDAPGNGTGEPVDLRGLQCPGPIMKIREIVGKASDGDRIAVIASDPGFASDIGAWCANNSCELLSLSGSPPEIKALIRKNANGSSTISPQERSCAKNGHSISVNPSAQNEFRITKGSTRVEYGQQKENKKGVTIVVFSGDLDKVLAAFVIANGAIAMGDSATIFFTFWGINALRKNAPQAPGKTLIDSMFGMMMPKGAGKLKLSKMNMLGAGTLMMKDVMKNKKVASLPELMDSAKKGGARLIVCSMSMDVMGIKKEELIDGVEIGGVATFLGEAYNSGATLFI
jgi:NADPH-dependent 2,4-dienoyl-CoA reductase/sulfur reductase-like enzyme/peroxiredoxin family protein/rhodanese-related sulfurtransferase/TusA-related sulfurtransferase